MQWILVCPRSCRWMWPAKASKDIFVWFLGSGAAIWQFRFRCFCAKWG
jgi:hypothetical protein